MSITVRVTKNILPDLARSMPGDVRKARRATAERVRDDWANDVRVDSGEYRDSIEIMEDTEDETVISSDVEHSKWNEYGSRTITARPSARQAAEKARGTFETEVRKALRG